jgi:hypothetical protein
MLMNTRKRVLWAAGIALLLLGVYLERRDFSGIDVSESVSSPVQSTDERYVNFVREYVPGASARSDTELINGGKQLCTQLDEGMTIDQMAVAGSLWGMNLKELGYALSAAMNSYCPEHL